jgi:phosphinothricin acetyltransferase
MSDEVVIRMASEDDAEHLLKIYEPYVMETAITFECSVPLLTEFKGRIKRTLKKYPYLVAVTGDQIIGYAYASAFYDRAAYDWAVETTVYLKRDCRGKGIGKRLYLALEDILKRQNILNLNACLAYTGVADAHLDNSSKAFHERLGYSKVAHFNQCGYKFDTWYDTIWMEKVLGDHDVPPLPFIPILEMIDVIAASNCEEKDESL